jgi:hypothetical protein
MPRISHEHKALYKFKIRALLSRAGGWVEGKRHTPFKNDRWPRKSRASAESYQQILERLERAETMMRFVAWRPDLAGVDWLKNLRNCRRRFGSSSTESENECTRSILQFTKIQTPFASSTSGTRPGSH